MKEKITLNLKEIGAELKFKAGGIKRAELHSGIADLEKKNDLQGIRLLAKKFSQHEEYARIVFFLKRPVPLHHVEIGKYSGRIDMDTVKRG